MRERNKGQLKIIIMDAFHEDIKTRRRSHKVKNGN